MRFLISAQTTVYLSVLTALSHVSIIQLAYTNVMLPLDHASIVALVKLGVQKVVKIVTRLFANATSLTTTMSIGSVRRGLNLIN